VYYKEDLSIHAKKEGNKDYGKMAFLAANSFKEY
jgi:hypothetical protein